jgi:hypothetical protein
MPRKKSYTLEEVNAILRASDGRLSPVTGEPGHALSKHVGVGGLQLSDRLRGTAMSSPSRPIVMDVDGRTAPETVYRDVWREIDARNGIQSTTKQLKSDYRKMVENYVEKSGSFIDAQQAIRIGRHLLNSPAGQAELARLDAGTDRVAITQSLNLIESTDGAWKMNFAGMPTAAHPENDISHLVDFNQAFMLVDRLDLDAIHIQTFFPMKT